MSSSRGDFGTRINDSGGSVGQLTHQARESQPFAAPGRNPALDYDNLSDQVGASVTQINSNVASIQRMALLLATVKDTAELRSQLTSVQRSTTTLIKAVNENLHRLETFSSSSKSQRLQRSLQQERLRQNFKDSLSKFHTVEKLVVQKQKEAIALARQSVSLTSGGIDENESIEEDQLLDARREMLQRQQEQDQANLQAVLEREEALRQLESDVADVNDIFRDLGQMVHDQGYVIDTIEQNVDMAAVDVQGGNQELLIAERHQKKVRNKRCFLLVSFLVVAGVLALIIVLANQ